MHFLQENRQHDSKLLHIVRSLLPILGLKISKMEVGRAQRKVDTTCFRGWLESHFIAGEFVCFHIEFRSQKL